MDDLAGRTLVVVDLEATCWGPDQPELREAQWEISDIIEFGAVRLDPRTLDLGDTFQSLVRPVDNPVLSSFCTRFTRISQADVDTAPSFSEVMDRLGEWLGDGEPPLLLSWGPFETYILERTCRAHGVRNPFPDIALDIREEFAAWSRNQGHLKWWLNTRQALERLRIDHDGRLHRALEDARAVARIFQVLRSPERVSPRGREVLTVLCEHFPGVTRLADLMYRDEDARPVERADWPLICGEMTRLGFATRRGDTLRATETGLEWNARLP